MRTARRFFVLLAITTLMIALVAACGTKVQESAPTVATEQPKGEATTKMITDSKGHTVVIPTQARKIVYTGSDLGDLLALGIKPAGAALGVIAKQVAYPDLLVGIQDIGDVSANLEKVLSLEPDLILMDSGGTYYKSTDYDALNKIAPTVTYDRLPTFERLLVIGDILGKKQAAEKWIQDFKGKVAGMKGKLTVKEGETATVFIRLGKEFYVMGNSGFSTILYDTLGYKPAPKVKQTLIDKNERFSDVSNEVMPEFAGDYLFVLTDDNEAARAASDSFTNDSVYKSIKAVANKQVYYIPTKWNFDDPITKDRLLDELPKLMK
ncbi:ABC transporter substrate-binding protein [Paenibacillus marchantiophytorum]|uniref:ABC transporter substrate-binding protein n=1 Tax=Paenibacillus marchantiophytorum TaxID=1619310 RepID=A0ABQ2BQ96_9BACL|nr:ABC transporter substrate-binding protein [Paenibacillus marchantiophytorum]GGI45059.1 ABC transporter substrate-binding protein [Paenibacillus marchantiophytorum]